MMAASMIDGAVLDRLKLLLSDVTGAPVDGLSEASSPANTPGWDSVANLGFIAAVEEEFNLTIRTADALELSSLGDMARFVGK
jgi:acyl carrier protein